MNRWRSRHFIRCAIAALMLFSVGATGVVVGASPAYAAGPGSWTQTQVNTAIANGVAYLGTQQNVDGSIGTSAPIAETGMALLAYGVLANGSFSSLSTTDQTQVKNAISYLLAQQDTSGDATNGGWGGDGFFTYSTGIAIAGLNAFKGVNSAIPTAISLGRSFLMTDFQAPPNTTCTTAQADSTSTYCGGWNYEESYGRSDESNTGYAMFGLNETGGVPSGIQTLNAGWQNNVQADTSTNPTYAGMDNDGGASYQPVDISPGSAFTSNANDTGTMLFSYGYDGIAGTDSRVKAGLTLGQDIVDEYELEKGTTNAYTMVYHSGTSADGTCTIGAVGCDWNAAFGEGGFHYSMFSLTKGLGSFITPNLADGSNWYAKVVDLLLSQQNTDGSWPPDGRDDATTVFATGLSVASLGKVGVPPPPPPPSGCSSRPTVTHVYPIGNPKSEIVRVLITGKCLSGATHVMFGSVAAGSFTVLSNHSIQASPPQQPAGTVDVTVTTPGGTSAISPPGDQYTYYLPQITLVAPHAGPATGGTMVILRGTNLGGPTKVMFGTTPAVSFGQTGDYTVMAVAPLHSKGTVDITVTTLTGTSATGGADRYRYK